MSHQRSKWRGGWSAALSSAATEPLTHKLHYSCRKGKNVGSCCWNIGSTSLFTAGILAACFYQRQPRTGIGNFTWWWGQLFFACPVPPDEHKVTEVKIYDCLQEIELETQFLAGSSVLSFIALPRARLFETSKSHLVCFHLFLISALPPRLSVAVAGAILTWTILE